MKFIADCGIIFTRNIIAQIFIIKTQFTKKLTIRYFAAAAAKSLQSCPTLCDPIDGSPPGSPIPGILQARTLEWVAISFSKVIYIPAKLPGDSE